MSLLPPQSSEDQEIYVAIPPPLVPPLARQLGSSHDSGSTHLPTPISTNNSSVSQSYAQWILDNQFQRATLQGLNGHGNASVSGLGTRTNLESSSETHSRPSGESSSNTQSNSRSPISPVSPTLPSQLLNRLYSFSTVMNPSQSDVSCTSSQLGTTSRSGGAGTSLGITSASFFTTNPIFGSSNNNNNNNGNGSSSSNNHNGSNSRSFLQYPSLGHSPELLRGGSTSFTTESTREAAATAIVNTLNRGEVRPSRGESPYIPSSLSMLFSDPEVMQLQEEVERAQMYQHQQRMRQRYLDSRRSFSGDAGLSNINTIEQPATIGEEDDDVDLIDDDEDGDDDNDLVNREDQQLLGSAQREMHYGYELVQDEQQEDDVYHPYATVMSRSDYLAPHEPSSSSPLFPSPLTTLGRFTSLSDQLEEQAQAGRIWQGYGTMDNTAHGQPDVATPVNQSHTAYYHAVSNYHYSSQDQIGSDGSRVGGVGSSSGIGASSYTAPIPCIPGSAQWRRNRGRDNSYQSYASFGDTSGQNNNNNNSNNTTRKRWFPCWQEDSSEDNWLSGMVISIVGCWICCESPLACCSG